MVFVNQKVPIKPDLVAAPGENGKIRNYVAIGEKLVQRQKPKKPELNGKVLIVKGKFADEVGTITQINEDKAECSVELELNESIVKVNLKDVIPYEASHANRNQDSDHLSGTKSENEADKKARKDKKDKKKEKKRPRN